MRAAAATGIRKSIAPAGGLLMASATGVATLALAAAAFVIYVLWPRWPDVPAPAGAPPLPIVIGDTTFQVPPGAIRVKLQRRSGAQDRLDLAFAWPALAPAAATADAAPGATERIFVTIASAPGALSPADRLKMVYPRYADPVAKPGPDGLLTVAFRDGTPYQGEELLFDHTAPDRFLARCTRDKGLARGTCLTDRLIGTTEITIRFPRAWLSDWRGLADGADRLIAQLRPGG